MADLNNPKKASKSVATKSFTAVRSKRGLTTADHEDGYTHFYWNGHDVTGHWMWFFGGLRLNEEKYCAWLYAKRHGKELNKELPL